MSTFIRIISCERMWLHLPGGMLNAFFLVEYPVLGIGILVAFLVYEIWQCHTTNDGAHLDILGHLIGLYAGGLLLLYLSYGGLLWYSAAGVEVPLPDPSYLCVL